MKELPNDLQYYEFIPFDDSSKDLQAMSLLISYFHYFGRQELEIKKLNHKLHKANLALEIYTMNMMEGENLSPNSINLLVSNYTASEFRDLKNLESYLNQLRKSVLGQDILLTSSLIEGLKNLATGLHPKKKEILNEFFKKDFDFDLPTEGMTLKIVEVGNRCIDLLKGIVPQEMIRVFLSVKDFNDYNKELKELSEEIDSVKNDLNELFLVLQPDSERQQS